MNFTLTEHAVMRTEIGSFTPAWNFEAIPRIEEMRQVIL